MILKKKDSSYKSWGINLKMVCVFQVKELQWNSDSTVLGVWMEDLKPGEINHPNTYSKMQIKLLCIFSDGVSNNQWC